MSRLEIRAVQKRFRGLVALSDVSLDIHATEATGIIGPNGSGKTTLFNVITGFLRPETGEIRWKGTDITGRSPHDIARLGVVRTFQQKMVFPRLSVYKNVEVAALAAGLVGRARDVEVGKGLALLRIEEYAREPAGSVPFGIARRVGIACTLPLRPALLLLDEPATGLNSQEVSQLAEALHAIRGEGIGIGLIDHNMGFVMPFCDRIVVMNAGVKIADGDPASIRQNKELGRVYLGPSVEG